MTLTGGCYGAINEPCCVGHAVQISLFAKMPHLRSHVADLHHRFEADVLLDAQREVVDGGCLRVGFNCVDAAWPCWIRLKTCQVSDGGGSGTGNRQAALIRWIADQVPASGPASGKV